MHLIILSAATCYEKNSLDITCLGIIVGYLFKNSPAILIEVGEIDSMCLTEFGLAWISNGKIANAIF